MKAGIIIYQSKYGSTKKYVEWLMEEIQFDCIKTSNANIIRLFYVGVLMLREFQEYLF